MERREGRRSCVRKTHDTLPSNSVKVNKDKNDLKKILTINEIQDLLDADDTDINISGDEVRVVMIPPNEPDDQDSARDSDNSDSLDRDVSKLSSKLLEAEAEVDFDGSDEKEEGS